MAPHAARQRACSRFSRQRAAAHAQAVFRLPPVKRLFCWAPFFSRLAPAGSPPHALHVAMPPRPAACRRPAPRLLPMPRRTSAPPMPRRPLCRAPQPPRRAAQIRVCRLRDILMMRTFR
jgi:hypothetical protein